MKRRHEKKLQDFSFDKSRYERTNQKKICGWSLFGKPCVTGPDENGNCRAQYECLPYKNGDRWTCTRPSSNGGRCQHGPSADGICRHKSPKCVPVDSLRNKRKKFILFTVALTIIALVLVLSTTYSKNFFSPGELTIAHSLKDDNCTACHQSSPDSIFNWLHSVFINATEQKSNKKCLSCHDIGFYDASPHSLDPGLLKKITETTVKIDSSSFNLFSPASVDLFDTENNIITCKSCHREHKGRNHDMTVLDNQQCSGCHVNEHTNFVANHPEFSDYPYKRRQRIVFDHAGHISDYFDKDKLKIYAPKTCATCHELDDTGRYMLAKSFEQTCMSCHVKDVTGEKLEAKGIPVFNIPALDIEVLTKNGYNVGQWPAELEDEELTGLMMFLLSSNVNIQPLLEKISKGEVELYDLSGVDIKILKQVQLLAWEIKNLLNEIVTGGHSALLKRVKQSGKFSQSEINAKLVGKLPINLLVEAQKSWFPSLSKEITLYEAKDIPRTSSVNAKSLASVNIPNEDWTKAGGWYGDNFSLFYRPGSHADEFLYSWLEIVRQKESSVSVMSTAAFRQLSYSKLPGQCTKCHSVDQLRNETVVNWKGYRYNSDEHKFTDFNHKTHFSVLDESDCDKCHEMDLESNFLAGYEDNNLQTYTSNWKPMNKSACSSCHTTKAAGEDCTLCHNYHVGLFDMSIPGSSMSK